MEVVKAEGLPAPAEDHTSPWSRAVDAVAHSCNAAVAFITCEPAAVVQPRDQQRRASFTRLRDADDNDEEWPAGIVNPTAGPKVKWDMFIMLLILYAAATVPIRVAFSADAEGFMWVVEASMSVIFLGDIALTFNTAVLVDGKWVTSRCTIAQRYCSGWFWVDAPSSIPVELIELAMPHGSDTGVLGAFRFLRVFRLVRLIRLLKVEKYISSLEEYLETSLRALGLLQIFFKLVFIAHLLACGFYYVGTLAGDETSWIESYDERAASGSLSTQYLVCFYWSLTTLTTVGYGDITPVTDVERQFTIFALLVGALVFATLVGDITSLLDALNQQNKLVEERMQSLKEYLEWRQIPRDLSIRIRRYYEYYYTKRPVFDEHLILNGLNPTLHSEMVQHIVKNTLGRAPIAELLSPDFKKALFPLLKPLSMSAGEIIFRRGAPSHDLLFLLDGEVEVFSEIDDTLPVRRISSTEESFLSEEDPDCVLVRQRCLGCFGQSVLLGKHRLETHVAHTACEMLVISKADLEQLFAADPVSARRFCHSVLREPLAQFKRRSLAFKLRIAAQPIDQRRRAAMIIQYSWRRYADFQAQEYDALYKLVVMHHSFNRQQTAQNRAATKLMRSMASRSAKSQHTLPKVKAQSPSPVRKPSAGADPNVASSLRDIQATLNALVKRSGAGANAPRTVPADSPITFREIRPMFEKLTSRIDAMEKKLDAMAEEKPDESIHGERTYLSLMSADVSA